MSWLDKLSGLVKVHLRVHLSRLINIDKSRTVNIHITSSPDSPAVHHDPKTNLLQINPEKLGHDEQRRIAGALRLALGEGSAVIERESEEVIKALREEEHQNQSILSSLRPYLTGEDFRILRAALFLRRCYQLGQKERVQMLKADIIRAFGRRGNTIANLCSAGYFEGFIIPILNEMKKDAKFDPDRFKKFFDRVVREEAFAVFVSARMPSTKISEAIRKKITANKKYGLGYVTIHGIGAANVKKVRTTVARALQNNPRLSKTREQIIGDAIVIRLEFNTSPKTLPSESGE